jgi:hypothetical protein
LMVFVKKEPNLEAGVWKNSFCFECLGVKIGFRSDQRGFISRIKKRLPEIIPIAWSKIAPDKAEHLFSIVKTGKSGAEYRIYKNSEFISTRFSLTEILDYLESQIRLTVAEFAEEFVFLHAGAVSWKGKGIIIPGKSFSGKTTLVSELIKRDCEYLSDEYAVIDRDGLIHPFPKKLSMRGIIDDYKQVDLEVEEFGGRAARAPVPVGYLLVTEYKKNAKKPRIKLDSTGEGVLVGVANSVSVRQNPKLVLEVLSLITRDALVLKSKRGEAGAFADLLLNYLENLEKAENPEKNGEPRGL